MLQAATGAADLRWMLAPVARIGLSWSPDWLRRRLHDDHDGAARRITPHERPVARA
jgi:hypothetical protein